MNGEPRECRDPRRCSTCWRISGLDPRTVVVERNREIVRRPRLGETAVADGDPIELVHFVGGG